MIVYKIIIPWEIFTPMLADGLSLEVEWQQISMTLLTILANLNNVVVWMVSTCPPISKSSSLFTNSLGIVLSVPITVIIIYLKPCNCIQTITWIHRIVYKLLVLNRNTWNHMTVCNLFLLDINT